MGSSSSKFRKYLQHGDEYPALHLYQHNSDLRKALDPNSSYGDNYGHDTPLHFACKHGMKSLIRIFLGDHGGNPNKRNASNENSLHCVCKALNGRNFAVQQRRLECLSIMLQWRGATLKDGEVERVDLAAQDDKSNTPLHYAAASGLKKCVELLVAQGSPLFVENGQKQTPCDCAEKNGHSEIALYLESKMVFSQEEEGGDSSSEILTIMETDESYSGLRAQDLQEAKDQLLVETSDMLRVPLFTAEALLRNHEWSREVLLEAWMEDPIACCEKSGVLPPASLFENQNKPGPSLMCEIELATPTCSYMPSNDIICDICAGIISPSDEPVSIACDHQFCRTCWERYLSGKITEGDAHNITCPGYECTKLVPVEIIETLVSRDMARRYLQFDIKAFVDSNPNIKWCPYPGCGRAVRLPEGENPTSPTLLGAAAGTWGVATDTSRAVDCGNGHYYCWECLGEAHEPSSCDNWKRWHEKIAEIKPEELSKTEDETELAANCLWLVTNSKPCPNCKSPIQKNEGCNHMKCSKCKHDFCWVCLEGWKKHSSATGGYFRCNRYEVVKKVEEHNDLMKSEAEAKHKKMQELNKFVHYYSRFKNHENSYKLEEPLLSTAKEKMMVLAKAVTDPETANMETKFVEDAVHQLLKARRVLKCSYVYGYYLEETGYKKPIFEFMQTELEECTEALSEMIARPYLRTPRCKIIQTAHLVQRKRHEFLTAIAKGLVPPDSSPTLRKRKKKFSVELDDDLKKALLASIQDLDPNNPWVKDPTGKHTNVIALLDWPEESDDSDTEGANKKADKQSNEDNPEEEGAAAACPGTSSESEESASISIPEPVAVCVREGCNRPRAKNPRTEEIHDHCSIRCMRLDQLERKKKTGDEEELPAPSGDFHAELDLLRALEMSRIQFMREMGLLRPGTEEEPDTTPIGTSPMPSPQPERLQLQDPPKRETPDPTPDLTDPVPEPEPESTAEPSGEFDTELQRALELSRLQVEEEDADLKLAIQLSLKETDVDADAAPSVDGDQLEEAAVAAAQAPSAGYRVNQAGSQTESSMSITLTGDGMDRTRENRPLYITNIDSDDSIDCAFDKKPSYISSADIDDGIERTRESKPLYITSIDDDTLGACGGTTLLPPPMPGTMSPHHGAGIARERKHSAPAEPEVSVRVKADHVSKSRPASCIITPSNRSDDVSMVTSSTNPADVSKFMDGNSGNSNLLPQLNTFGIIKDISVNNILSSDADKTCEFDSKDFSLLYMKSPSEDVKEQVFEPRPQQTIPTQTKSTRPGIKRVENVSRQPTQQERKTTTSGQESNSTGYTSRRHPPQLLIRQENLFDSCSNSSEKSSCPLSVARALDCRKGGSTIIFRAKKQSKTKTEQFEMKDTHTGNLNAQVTNLNQSEPSNSQYPLLAPMASIETLDQSVCESELDQSDLEGNSPDNDNITTSGVHEPGPNVPLLSDEPRLNNHVHSGRQNRQYLHLAPSGDNNGNSEECQEEKDAVYV